MVRWLCNVVLLLSAAAAPAAGRVRVSLPHDGYYRVGRYMPVRLAAADPANPPRGAEMRIAAVGAVPALLPDGFGPASTVVSLLMLDAGAHDLTVRSGDDVQVTGLALRPLGDNDRLVAIAATAGDAPGAIAALFADGTNVIRVPLEPLSARPRMTVPLSWATYDAVIVDGATLDSLGDDGIALLLAAGTSLVTTRSPAVASSLPWQRQGDAWVLRHPPPAAPIGVIEPDAYLPVAGWEPGWPREVRHQALVRGALFVILTLAALLWRTRWVVLVVVGLVVLYGALVHVWWVRQPALRTAEGDVVVTGATLEREDHWYYASAVKETTQNVNTAEGWWPVFASRAHAEQVGAWLYCRADGAPMLMAYRLPRRSMMAAVQPRVTLPATRSVRRTPVTSPLWALVPRLYATSGIRVVGEEPSPANLYELDRPTEWSDEIWPTVVLRRDDAEQSGAPR